MDDSSILALDATSPYILGMTLTRLALICCLILVTGGAVAGWLLLQNPFDEPRLYATAAEPLDVAVDDLDGDGDMDVVTANREGRSLSVFLGRGDGTLDEPLTVDTGFGATSIALADIDQDGKMDAVVTGCEPGCQSSSVMILPGRGDGSFESATMLPCDGVPYNVTVGDLNDDRWPDLAATDYPGNKLWIWLSDGSELGFEVLSLPTGSKPIALAIDDLDDDGYLDLIVSNHGSDDATVYLGYGREGFSEPIEIPTGDLPYSIAVDKLDGDRIPDLVVAQSTDPGRVLIMQGRGDGTFSHRQDFEVEGIPIYVALADVDLDGAKDIAISRQAGEFVGLFLNEGDGLFNDQEIRAEVQNKIYSLIVTQFDRDGLPDLVSVDFEGGTVGIARGREPETP